MHRGEDTFEIVNGAGYVGGVLVDYAETWSVNFGEANQRSIEVTFENGWRLSAAFGTGSYSSNRDWHFGPERPATTAELAVADPDGHLLEFEGWTGGVGAYCTPEDYWSRYAEVKAYNPGMRAEDLQMA